MRSWAKPFALGAAACLLAGGCPSGPKGGPGPPAASGRRAGGTLRVGVLTQGSGVGTCEFTFCGGQHNDPQWAGEDPMSYEIDRCCLLRTLLNYSGEPTSRGGTRLRPDIATQLPTVSGDGLTWTFHLKPGIHYAPPLERTEVVAGDFIRSIERLLGPPPPDGPSYYGNVLDPYVGGYLDLADLIDGARAYIDRKAGHISGLEAPDQHTLRVHLTRVDGALASILSEPDVAPIPSNPLHPTARFGVLDGHPRLAFPYMVASGPYMIEGAPKLDFSKAPNQQLPASGDAPSSLTLVRNPSWDPRTDQLRAANPDRIVLTPVASEHDALALVQSGALDLVFNWEPTPGLLAPGTTEERTHSYTTPRDWVVFVALNTAVPPLDDPNVRRAMNFAIARDPVAAAFQKAGRPAVPATHIGLDSEEDNLLLNFDPFHAATGDLQTAKRLMALSRYDRNRDGLCDASACKRIRMLVRNDSPEDVQAARIVAKELAPIGIHVLVAPQDAQTFNSTYGKPERHVALRIDNWIKDLTSGSTYFPPLVGSPATGVTSSYGEPLLGASPALLRRWGYVVRSVPNVDGRIEDCLPLMFGAQIRCWADFDQYLMNEVVPWVPLVSLTTGRVVSSRMTGFGFDQSPPTPMPSLDRIVLRPGPTPSPSPVPSLLVPSIPDGIYRFTLTKEDLYRYDPRYDPGGVDENTGTYTMTLHRGWWIQVATADHPIYNPVAVGTYTGSGDTVLFATTQPTFNALSTPQMRWTFDGHDLRFRFLGCANLNHLDPMAPHLCDDIRASFEAYPWQKVG